MKRWWVFMVPVALAGCAPVSPVTVASYAVDGISYIFSGKSGTDHVLSAALERDCALYRVVRGDTVCTDTDDDAVAGAEPEAVEVAANAEPAGDPVRLPEDMAHLEAALPGVAQVARTGTAALAPAGFSSQMFTSPATGNPVSGDTGKSARSDDAATARDTAAMDAEGGKAAHLSPGAGAAVSYESLPDAPAKPESATSGLTLVAPARASEELAARSDMRADMQDAAAAYFVIGSFANRDSAAREARRNGAFLVPATVNGRRLHRVVLTGRDGLAPEVAASAWRLPACSADGAGTTCLDTALLERPN